MSKYAQTFDPEVFTGECDLISRFSDFVLYLGTRLVYEHTSLTISQYVNLLRIQATPNNHHDSPRYATNVLNSLKLP